MPGTRRSFTADFKARVVVELLTGAVTAAELCRKHSLNSNLLTRWKTTVLDRLPTLFADEGQPDHDQVRVAELERLVGRQAYELDPNLVKDLEIQGPNHVWVADITYIRLRRE